MIFQLEICPCLNEFTNILLPPYLLHLYALWCVYEDRPGLPISVACVYVSHFPLMLHKLAYGPLPNPAKTTWHIIMAAFRPATYRTRTTRTPAFWDTPRRPMITHTSDSHQMPSQNNAKWKLQFLKNCQNFKFLNFARNFARDTPSEVAW